MSIIIIIIIMVDVHFIPFSKKYNWNDAYDICLLSRLHKQEMKLAIKLMCQLYHSRKSHYTTVNKKKICFPFSFQECDKCKR